MSGIEKRPTIFICSFLFYYTFSNSAFSATAAASTAAFAAASYVVAATTDGAADYLATTKIFASATF